MTLLRKDCLIKSLALSKILYTASCVTVPDKIIQKIDERIFRYLWGMRDRIKRKSVINELERGGLQMVNVQSQVSALRAAWTYCKCPEDHAWSYLPKLYFSKYGNDYFCSQEYFYWCKTVSMDKTDPFVYQDVIISYNKSKVIQYDDFCQCIINQVLFGNKFLIFKNKTLLFKS